jgi:hypothetical protein
VNSESQIVIQMTRPVALGIHEHGGDGGVVGFKRIGTRSPTQRYPAQYLKERPAHSPRILFLPHQPHTTPLRNDPRERLLLFRVPCDYPAQFIRAVFGGVELLRGQQ